KDLSISCSGDFAHFDSLTIEGTNVKYSLRVLRPNIEFKAKEGSTIVTFIKKYIHTLKPGTYKVTFKYADEVDGATVDMGSSYTYFTIRSPKPGSASADISDNNDPMTGDGFKVYAYLLIIAFSIFGLGTLFIKRKKSNH
ncbi:MAG: hypothetical protein ACRCUS_08185, partial [Anaerovoracaceae bacterium]